MKHTDFKEVDNLAKGLLIDDKKLVLSIEKLDNELKSLEGTFLDDGIEDVKTFVKEVSAILVNAQEAFIKTAEELIVFADLLREGK